MEGGERVLGDAGWAAPSRPGVVGEDLHHLVAGGELAEAGVPAFGSRATLCQMLTVSMAVVALLRPCLGTGRRGFRAGRGS